MVVSQLTIAFQITDLVLTFVKESKSNKCKHRLAWQIIKNLADKYELKDEVSNVGLKRDLIKVNIQDNDGPKELLSQLTTIERIYASNSYEISKEDLMAVALEVAPEHAVIFAKELRDRGIVVTSDSSPHGLGTVNMKPG